ncbi:ClbS/DfsB family four-helix bundle protein [Photobacterium damselae]|uniref:ClbS/DfsB family four-helix bundle protein n=1 Tax=Photobacterium damselae TaxID=38293 RepID=UPI000AB52382|nr:ClbS/DfsB family four-helix bundle protein [Photobacterium damselae]BDR36283.1 hypothetical protein PDY_33310 [Photobacterium damselae subsp. damselae]
MSSIPTTKEELEKAINDSFSKLLIDLKSIPESESRTHSRHYLIINSIKNHGTKNGR